MINYWYFFLFFVIATAFSFGLLAGISLIRYRRNDYGDKCTPYECGVDPATPTARESYSIRFYLLTLVFIVFEAETFLLFPWAVAGAVNSVISLFYYFRIGRAIFFEDDPAGVPLDRSLNPRLILAAAALALLVFGIFPSLLGEFAVSSMLGK